MNTFISLLTPHGITSRMGGVSRGPYATMNTSFYGTDRAEDVFENIKRALDDIKSDAKIIIATQQVHSKRVLVVDASFDLTALKTVNVDGSALNGYQLFVAEQTDGIVTNRRDVVLMTFYADCVPLLGVDAENGVIMNVHSGWRGTASAISHVAVDEMLALGATIDCIKLGIGQCAGVCCYEVDQPVIDAFDGLFSADEIMTFAIVKENGRYMLDLKEANVRSFMKKGFERSKIEVIADCTICDEAHYHSHRRTGYPRGSMSAFIQLKG
jgi:polyphenol oxidase